MAAGVRGALSRVPRARRRHLSRGLPGQSWRAAGSLRLLARLLAGVSARPCPLPPSGPGSPLSWGSFCPLGYVANYALLIVYARYFILLVDIFYKIVANTGGYALSLYLRF